MFKESLKKSLRYISEEMFGKQNYNAYERPHFTVHPLNYMLKDLVEIPPMEWHSYAFAREPLNNKFSDSQRKNWMKKSIACGQKYARKIYEKYNTKDPVELAKFMKMNVSYPETPDRTDRVLFAEYRAPNQICIYMDAVQKANVYLKQPEVREILTENLNIRYLLLAHELYHNIEDTHKNEIFTQTEKIRLWKLGFIHNDSRVITLSEIAAMAFAQELSCIPYSPYVMNMFLVYCYSPEEASGIYEEMMKRANRIPVPYAV